MEEFLGFLMLGKYFSEHLFLATFQETYPTGTLGKGKTSSKMTWQGIFMLVPRRVYIYPCAIQVASVQPNSRRDGFRG